MCKILGYPLGILTYELFVFLYEQFGATPVVYHRWLFDISKLAMHAVEQFPIGIAPAVDTLLDIAHDKVVTTFAFRLADERVEVLPLQRTGVLKLIYHIVVQVLPHAFVNERCLLSVYHLVNEHIDIGDRHASYLLVGHADLVRDILYESDGVEVLRNSRSGIIVSKSFIKDARHLLIERLQLRLVEGEDSILLRLGGLALGE